jgi:hypothetical protein
MLASLTPGSSSSIWSAGAPGSALWDLPVVLPTLTGSLERMQLAPGDDEIVALGIAFLIHSTVAEFWIRAWRCSGDAPATARATLFPRRQYGRV